MCSGIQLNFLSFQKGTQIYPLLKWDAITIHKTTLIYASRKVKCLKESPNPKCSKLNIGDIMFLFVRKLL